MTISFVANVNPSAKLWLATSASAIVAKEPVMLGREVELRKADELRLEISEQGSFGLTPPT